MDPKDRILIVDDNPINVDILRRLLRKEYQLETAASGEECLAKVAQFRPQLVLLDIMMPGLDGYETCRQIKSQAGAAWVQVILVSGKGSTADRVRGYEAQADDYIVKPFDHAELLSKVRVQFRAKNVQASLARLDVNEALTGLCGLIKQMTVDIGEHSQLLEEIQHDLDGCRDASADIIIQAMVRLADTNRATQSRLAAAEQRLREQAQGIECQAAEARTDALTLLPNRRAFDDALLRRIGEAARMDTPFCAVMIDIDRFKLLNDSYGHLLGDEVLRKVGRTLGRTVRQMDLLARYGGDEFAAILPATSLEEGNSGARRIREAVEKCMVVFEAQRLSLTASIGVAQWLPGEDGVALLKRADTAMYASKKAGRNCIHWHDGRQCHLLDAGAAPPPPSAPLPPLQTTQPQAPHPTV